MLCHAQTILPDHAPVERFELLRGKLLCGQWLREIEALEDSLLRFGLLTPLIAITRGDKLIVMDGRKRLQAIRRLSFQGRLPRSLVQIPYLLAGDVKVHQRQNPLLVSHKRFYDAVLEEHQTGASVETISDRFRVSRQCVRDVLCLSRLSSVVRAAFFDNLIDFSQARAYAALPNPVAQLAKLKSLGPFATPNAIRGETEPQATPYKAAA